MKIRPVAEVKARFSSYLEQCREAPVIVTKNGRPAAVLVAVPKDEEELERLVLTHTAKFRRLLERAAARIDKEGGIPHKEFWKAVSKGR